MRTMAAVRDAIEAEIKNITAELARLKRMLRQLDGDEQPTSVGTSVKAATPKQRLRLKDDVAAKISQAIVKAVKSHRDGASRADIVDYLGRCGWTAGHHYNEPHLNKLVTTLLSGETPAIRRESAKGNTRYYTT